MNKHGVWFLVAIGPDSQSVINWLDLTRAVIIARLVTAMIMMMKANVTLRPKPTSRLGDNHPQCGCSHPLISGS
jgi:hypothetical protein